MINYYIEDKPANSVTMELKQEDGHITLYMDGVEVMYFSAADGSPTLLCVDAMDKEWLEAKGVTAWKRVQQPMMDMNPMYHLQVTYPLDLRLNND